MNKEDQNWKAKLTPEQYRVTREKGTEAPYTGKYLSEKEDGMYHCICCDAALFSSAVKYDSGCGWPSFFESLDTVGTRADDSYGMQRTEIFCKNCDAHLGHVFNDGPPETGKRFCVNSVSLDFKKKKTGNSAQERD